MPLTKLFQKRSSKKNKKSKTSSEETQSESTEEIEPPGVSSVTEVSEVNDVVQELINKTVELQLSDESVISAPSNTPVSNCGENEKNDSSVLESDSVDIDNSKRSSVPESDLVDMDNSESSTEQDKPQNSKFMTQKRSASESHFEVNVALIQGERRKFGSESNIVPISEKIIPLNQRKELDELIEGYVDKLIRDSIAKAVKNVTVDGLCQEILKDFSKRQSSESAESAEDFVVEQRLSSKSISELVDLESGDAASEKNIDCVDSISQDFNKFSEAESIQNEFGYEDHSTLSGYLADYEDTASVDDLKSIDEDSSICSISDGLQRQANANIKCNLEKLCESFSNVRENVLQTAGLENAAKKNGTFEVESKSSGVESSSSENEIEQKSSTVENSYAQKQKNHSEINISEPEGDCLAKNSEKEEQRLSSIECSEGLQEFSPTQSIGELKKEISSAENITDQDERTSSPESTTEHEQKTVVEKSPEQEDQLPSKENTRKLKQTLPTTQSTDDLIVMCPEDENLTFNNSTCSENENLPPDLEESLPQQPSSTDEEKKVNWKVGYLHVKLPPKSRGKTHLKAWKKRRVIIQPDEFVNDPKNPCLVISVYGADSRKHAAIFWQTVSSLKAVVYRSSSRTHQYAFTISDEGRAIIHLSAENESATQEWMAAIRAVLWPPSSFLQLEKMLSGREFEISLIDNEFSYHAGLLGMYGYLTITPRKLILLHPQQGYVIQEWYLNTVDKFQLVPQSKVDDSHKVLSMTTCRDSSTGAGEILLFCNEAVTLLQSLATTIHQVLTYRSKQEGGKYQREMEEMAEWMMSPPQDSLDMDSKSEEHYKVPTRQVKSLLDIPNFIFEKSLSPVASAIYPAPPSADILEPLEASKSKQTTTSHDSGISTCHSGEDFLNCSVTSFMVGGGSMTGKSSDSELSDAYTPPRSPEVMKKIQSQRPEEERLSVPKS